MREFRLNGKVVRIDPSKSIGKGGEADIFSLDPKTVLKIFKPPTHPDLLTPQDRLAAERRLHEHQRKLRILQFVAPYFPTGVVTPLALATNRQGMIVGYSMQYLDGATLLYQCADPEFRKTAGLPPDFDRDVMLKLHGIMSSLHRISVVIGDFNDLNVLVQGQEPSIIDSDSFQFSGYMCTVFTDRFVDPLLCDAAAVNPILHQPHTPESDEYAWTVMLMQMLLYTDPWSGTYRPKDSTKRVAHPTRPLRRISVFHPEVVYPRSARHYGILPDDLVQRFIRVFGEDQRDPFPLKLLEDLRWTTCARCGATHARAQCPDCKQAAPAAVRPVTTVRGRVTATRVFRTDGVILVSRPYGGQLLWLYHQKGRFRREDGSVVMDGALDPELRARVLSGQTIVAKGNQLVRLKPGEQPVIHGVDTFQGVPAFDVNDQGCIWAQAGQIYRDDQFAPELLGSVLQGQSLFWTGPHFGFGFSRAGEVNLAYVFDTRQRSLNDTVKVPLSGHLLDATACFAGDRCWFLASLKQGSRIINQCVIIRRDGSVIATAQADQGDGSWLSSIRGKCAIGPYLFSPTDDGIVRVEEQSGRISPTATYPDTEPFVDAGTHLYPGSGGLYAVRSKEIHLLQIQ